MAALLLNEANLAGFTKRVRELSPQSQRQWGKMDALSMQSHLRCAIDTSLGRVVAPDQSTIFARTVGCWLVFHVVPWPKGKIKAPEILFPAPEGDFESERGKLLGAMAEFIAAAGKEPQRKALHPIFGHKTLSYWALMHGKHFDHHLRQFGV